jgi:peptidyl-prolyl cis-trans isomerase C
MRRLGPLLLISSLALAGLGPFAFGCNEKAVKRAPDGGAIPGGLTAEQAQKPLAKFGDHVITLGDFAQALADMPEYERLRYQSIDRRKELLRSMIDVQLLADEAKRLGLDKDPTVGEEQRQILVAWMRGKILSDLPPPSSIPEAEVRAFYDGNLDLYREPERRRVAQVLTKDETIAKKAYDEAKKATPTEWGAIVKKLSDEKPADSEAPEMAGDVGYVTSPSDAHPPVSNKVTPEIRAAAFALKNVGDVAPPFKDTKGWHVIKVIAKNEARDQSFADVERTIRVRLLQDKRAAKEKAIVEETRAAVKIEIDEAALAQLTGAIPAPKPSSSEPEGVAPAPSPSTSAPASASVSASASASAKKPK